MTWQGTGGLLADVGARRPAVYFQQPADRAPHQFRRSISLTSNILQDSGIGDKRVAPTDRLQLRNVLLAADPVSLEVADNIAVAEAYNEHRYRSEWRRELPTVQAPLGHPSMAAVVSPFRHRRCRLETKRLGRFNIDVAGKLQQANQTPCKASAYSR